MSCQRKYSKAAVDARDAQGRKWTAKEVGAIWKTIGSEGAWASIGQRVRSAGGGKANIDRPGWKCNRFFSD